MAMEQGEVNLAGAVNARSQGEFPERCRALYMTPAQTALHSLPVQQLEPRNHTSTRP